jgi:two-component system CheB/CheR fusion protein
MLLNAFQIINEKSAEQFILLAIEDITERKKAEVKLRTFSLTQGSEIKQRTSDLEQSNLRLEQFAHTASHELQEPLRKIITFSKALQKWQGEDACPQDAKDYLTKIEHASERMSKLIQDMLNFASITQIEGLYEKTDLNAVLQNILFDFELLISEQQAKIISDGLPEIEAIPFQMNQLFYELIYNSLKFSRKDVTPVIHISSRKLTKAEVKAHQKLNESNAYFELTFKDNGIGFDQKYASQIFAMFQRLNKQNDYPGTGIGLALCKKIVQSYNGEIFAEGKENEGAIFHVILPSKHNAEPGNKKAIR